MNVFYVQLNPQTLLFLYHSQGERQNYTRGERRQSPCQNIELWPHPISLPSPSSFKGRSLVILINEVPWKKGEVRIHGAGDMSYREATNPKKRRCGDHGTVPFSVSYDSEGPKVISKDG